MTQLAHNIGQTTEIEFDIESSSNTDNISKTVTPGVTIFSDEDSTTRTSCLNAIVTGIGGLYLPSTPIEGLGKITVTLPSGKEVTRTITTQDDDVTVSGEELISDPEKFAPFAWFLSDNEIRDAIQNGNTSKLWSLVMRPAETTAIESQKEEFKKEYKELTEKIERIEQKHDDTEVIQADIEAFEERLNTVEAEIEELESQVAETGELSGELQELLREFDKLVQKKRSAESRRERRQTNIDDLSDDLSTKQGRVNRLNRELTSVKDSISGIDMNRDSLQQRCSQVQTALETVTETHSTIDNTIKFTQNVISGEYSQLHEKLTLADEQSNTVVSNDDPISELDQPNRQAREENRENVSESIRCWTCGSTTTVDTVSTQLPLLKKQREKMREQQNELQSELSHLRRKKDRYDSLVEKKEQVQEDINKFNMEIEMIKENIDQLESDLVQSDSNIETLCTQVRRKREQIRKGSDVAEEVVNTKEKIQKKAANREKTNQEILDRQSDLKEAKEAEKEKKILEAKQEKIQMKITHLETQLADIENDIVERLNRQVGTILSRLDLNTIEKITVKQAGGNGSASLEPQIIVKTDDGQTDKKSIEELSDMENDVVSFVVSLATYFTYSLYTEMPVVVIDPPKMISAEQFGRLLEYLADAIDYTVVGLSPELAGDIRDNQGERPAT